MSYYFAKTTNGSFDEAVARTTETLKKAGFGIITEIDAKETLKKVGVEFRELNAVDPQAYLTRTLIAIVNGHKQSQIDDLLHWNYPIKV